MVEYIIITPNTHNEGNERALHFFGASHNRCVEFGIQQTMNGVNHFRTLTQLNVIIVNRFMYVTIARNHYYISII